MTTVYCDYNDCICNKNFICTKEIISIGDSIGENICEDYMPYNELPEYQNEYFICVKTQDGNIGKAAKKGKRIERNGFVVYTQEYPVIDDDIYVTEERTGVKVYLRAAIDNWDKFCEKVKEADDVKDYPLCEKDEVTGEWGFCEERDGE